jgi:ABC-type multidrug transport system fused ATPase/permease subunit
VRLGREDAPAADIEAACRDAGVERFADDLPDRLMTRAGHFGSHLSQGQRQRVALARALLSPAPVLLLDEVTASMDGETESAIETALDAAFTNKTVMVITHRLATARWADRVIAIDEGRVIADGPASTVLDPSSPLITLFGAQGRS